MMPKKFLTKAEAQESSKKFCNHGKITILKIDGTPCFSEKDYWIAKFGEYKILMDNGEIKEPEYYGNAPLK